MIEFDHCFVGPKLIANLRSQHDLAPAFQQQQQNSKRLFAQPQADAVLAQFSRANIQFEGAETE